MFGRDGKVYMHLVTRTGIHGTFDQMLLDSLAAAVGIGMERHEPLGFVSVRQPRINDRGDDLTLGRTLRQHILQLLVKGETRQVLQNRIHPLAAAPFVHEFEQLLEHPCRRTRRGDELDHAQGIGRSLVARHRTT